MGQGLQGARIALVHDWLVTRGGSERVLEALVELLGYPPVYTLFYEPSAFASSPISRCRVHTSSLQRLPGATAHHRWLLPFMPFAVEQFDLRGYDIVISSSHAVAKGVLTRSDQLHISYIHTPMRYAWDVWHEYLSAPVRGRDDPVRIGDGAWDGVPPRRGWRPGRREWPVRLLYTRPRRLGAGRGHLQVAGRQGRCGRKGERAWGSSG